MSYGGFADELVDFVVVANSKLEKAGGDPGLLVYRSIFRYNGFILPHSGHEGRKANDSEQMSVSGKVEGIKRDDWSSRSLTVSARIPGELHQFRDEVFEHGS